MTALQAGAGAFLRAVVIGLPDRHRFTIRRVLPMRPWEHVEVARMGSPNKYRWRCPDASYDWHYAVDDQGFTATNEEAQVRLATHWSMHHLAWEADRREHEAWDEWIREVVR